MVCTFTSMSSIFNVSCLQACLCVYVFVCSFVYVHKCSFFLVFRFLLCSVCIYHHHFFLYSYYKLIIHDYVLLYVDLLYKFLTNWFVIFSLSFFAHKLQNFITILWKILRHYSYICASKYVQIHDCLETMEVCWHVHHVEDYCNCWYRCWFHVMSMSLD